MMSLQAVILIADSWNFLLFTTLKADCSKVLPVVFLKELLDLI